MTSARVRDADARAGERHARQRGVLRPLGWALIAIVVAGTATAHPAAALHGTGAGVTVALVAFAAGLAAWTGERFAAGGERAQLALTAVLGAAALALAALQPHGPAPVAASVAVWASVTRLAPRHGVALAAAVTGGLAAASAARGSSAAAVLASTLLCILLALTAQLVKRSREGQDRTELLLAELEDARDAEARAAAAAERARIASELHDVLAHTLSGAAIQLQGARMLAERERAQPQVQTAIERASELVRDGLADARHAVAALRGGELASIEGLGALVAGFRDDMNIDVRLAIEGRARRLSPEASHALYRGAQEALTNVARYAPDASTSVVLSYGAQRARLAVEDRASGARSNGSLSGVGGGRGLASMRERLERAGGTMQAGPTAAGWLVELEVPV